MRQKSHQASRALLSSEPSLPQGMETRGLRSLGAAPFSRSINSLNLFDDWAVFRSNSPTHFTMIKSFIFLRLSTTITALLCALGSSAHAQTPHWIWHPNDGQSATNGEIRFFR